MRIVINSHRNSLVALNHLLDSMQRHQEFYCFDYIIAVGGYYELKDYEVDHICNIHYIKCNHNSIDFNGLLAIIEPWNNTDDYYFYMHDTCRVGDNFFRRLIEINETLLKPPNKISSIKLGIPSMNMGIYSKEILNHYKDFLLSKKNMNKEREIDFKINSHEDFMFINDPNNIMLEPYQYTPFTGPTDYYNTGVMRIVEYLSNVDLYKIKANWGQGTWTLKN